MKLAPHALACLPALGLAALAVALGVAGLADGSVANPAAAQPRPADLSTVASPALAPVTTSRDWTEVVGTKSNGKFR